LVEHAQPEGDMRIVRHPSTMLRVHTRFASREHAIT
jgi:hypothetical protein